MIRLRGEGLKGRCPDKSFSSESHVSGRLRRWGFYDSFCKEAKLLGKEVHETDESKRKLQAESTVDRGLESSQ